MGTGKRRRVGGGSGHDDNRTLPSASRRRSQRASLLLHCLVRDLREESARKHTLIIAPRVHKWLADKPPPRLFRGFQILAPLAMQRAGRRDETALHTPCRTRRVELW